MQLEDSTGPNGGIPSIYSYAKEAHRIVDFFLAERKIMALKTGLPNPTHI
jgi:hypothetical protein